MIRDKGKGGWGDYDQSVIVYSNKLFPYLSICNLVIMYQLWQYRILTSSVNSTTDLDKSAVLASVIVDADPANKTKYTSGL